MTGQPEPVLPLPLELKETTLKLGDLISLANGGYGEVDEDVVFWARLKIGEALTAPFRP